MTTQLANEFIRVMCATHDNKLRTIISHDGNWKLVIPVQ